CKAAGFIEGDSQRTVPCSHLQDLISSPVCFIQKADHLSSISPSLAFRRYSQIFDLQDSVSLVCNYALCFHSVILEDVHCSPLQITVDHVFLLIGQKKQIQIFFFIFLHTADTACLFLHISHPRNNTTKLSPISVFPGPGQISAPGFGLCQKNPVHFLTRHKPFLRGLRFCHTF